MLNYLKIRGCRVIGQVGITGVCLIALCSHSGAENSLTIASTVPNAAAIYFEPMEGEHSPRIDFAELDYQHPLTLAQRVQLTPTFIQNLPQEHLDQLYARLTAGPIPNGSFEGTAFLPPHHREQMTRIWQILGLIASSHTKDYYQLIHDRWIELWQGKVFDRRRKILHNRVNLELVHNMAPLLGQQLAQALHNLPKDALLFPAKMYCGQSKLDSRRESIILDYAYNDDLPQYREEIDGLVGRKGLHIRDEIRMIHPGLYLGRVYLGKFFLINFILMNEDLTQAWDRQGTKREMFPTTHSTFQEDCWAGTQNKH